MVKRARVVLCLMLVAALLGCGQVVETDSQGENHSLMLRAAEIHSIQEEATRACMAKAGFEYTPRVFIDFGRSDDGSELSPFVNVVGVKGAAEVGYGTVLNALATIAPLGGPPAALPIEEAQAYDKAFFGRDSDQGGRYEADPESYAPGGCLKAGLDARSEAGEQNEFVSLSREYRREVRKEFLARLSALPEYVSFSERWATCMKEAGVEPLASDPAMHPVNYRENHFLDILAVVHRLTGEEDKNGSGPLIDLRTVQVFDTSHKEAIFAEHPVLEDLYSKEVQVAKIDAVCRSETVGELLPIANELETELLGQ